MLAVLRHDERLSWPLISDHLRNDHGVVVSHETVRRWAKELGVHSSAVRGGVRVGDVTSEHP